MGKYAVPAEVRAMKPRGTMVKRISRGYYVYEVSNERLADGGRRTKMGRCIGKIDPSSGFVPNGGLLRGEDVTCLDFGEWWRWRTRAARSGCCASSSTPPTPTGYTSPRSYTSSRASPT